MGHLSTPFDARPLTREPKHILEMYGAEPGKASFANDYLLARRLVERGVALRPGEGHRAELQAHRSAVHGADPRSETARHAGRHSGDRGGEFGRTQMVQGGSDGRDHHPNAFTMWLAGTSKRDSSVSPIATPGLMPPQGRDFRRTDVAGDVVKQVLA